MQIDDFLRCRKELLTERFARAGFRQVMLMAQKKAQQVCVETFPQVPYSLLSGDFSLVSLSPLCHLSLRPNR